jgi:acid stress-induced BolA-like protein IbaG/YrbA
MDATLKQKRSKEASRKACSPAPADVHLEDAGSSHVGGQVVSPRFDGMTPSQRQDLIWAHLDVALARHEATRISFIVADTPSERDARLAQSHAG